MGREGTASPGALGGSYNEIGGEYRAYVGALLASCVLRGESLAAVRLPVGLGNATLIEAEGDQPVDDLVVETDQGDRVYFQAKKSAGLTRGDTPFAKALIQFSKALEAGLGENDLLILATGHARKPLRFLGRLLDRRRLDTQARPDPSEARALESFHEIAAAVVPDADPEQLLDRMLIWNTDPCEGDGRLALEGRLEGSVARSGSGDDAARELADVIRMLARLRGGLGALGLVGELVNRNVPISPAAPITSPVRQGAALVRHRDRMQRSGETLRLLGVSGRLADIPFEAANAEIKVTVEGEEETGFGHDPVLALRRRGRALLIGRPGGGKTTTLRSIAAHWAARADWPVPLAVHLKRLASRGSGFTAALLDAATDEHAGAERVALRGALENELARGRALLVLDGLDEVRKGRKLFVSELAEWLDALHPDVEVVIACRPVALGDAEALGLRSLTLKEPESAQRTADAIVRAAADEHIEEAERESWAAERRGWITGVLDRNRELSATPLMVVLVALAAVDARKVEELPSRRAQVLKRSVEDAIRGWEVEARRRGDVAVGSLTGERATEALSVSFRLLGHKAIAESPPDRLEVGADLSALLTAQFGLVSGDARAAASETLAFWEEAGLFGFDGGDLTANVRSLAELGSAWMASELNPEEQIRWVSGIREQRDLWACLGLAAGLTAHIAELWAHGLAVGGPADEISTLLSAYRDGVEFTSESLASVALGAKNGALNDAPEAEDAAWVLIDLPVDQMTRMTLRPHFFRSVPAERKRVVEARVILRWEERGADADRLLRALISGPKPPHPSPPRDDARNRGHFVLEFHWDRHFDLVFEEAVLRLAKGSRQDAELAVSSVEDPGFEMVRLLRQALREGGNGDIELTEPAAPSLGGLYREPGVFDEAEQKMLGWVAEMAPPQVLDWRRQRRLSEIADLWETFRANWISPRWALDRPEIARPWIEIAIVLGGFDERVLAAEAKQILDELDAGDDVTSMLFDAGKAYPLIEWASVEDPAGTVEQLVRTIGLCSRQVMVAITKALKNAPRELGVAASLSIRVGQLRAWSHWFAALTVLEIHPDADDVARDWLDSEDPLLRSPSAMWWVERLIVHGDGENEVLRALDDEDGDVRDLAVDMMPEAWVLPTTIRLRLEEIAAEEPVGWRCRRCGTDNPPGAGRGCSHCHVVGPDPAATARKRLESP